MSVLKTNFIYLIVICLLCHYAGYLWHILQLWLEIELRRNKLQFWEKIVSAVVGIDDG
jgi:hypothetical protein